MRPYSQVTPGWWTGESGRELTRQALVETDAAYVRALELRVLEGWLMTGSQHNQYGLYYAPLVIINAETGIKLGHLEARLADLRDMKFCSYDVATQFVWVHEMAAYQLPLPLKATDNQARAAVRWYETCPQNPFLGPFWDRYHEELLRAADRDGNIFEAVKRSLGRGRTSRSPLQPPSISPSEGAVRSPLSPVPVPDRNGRGVGKPDANELLAQVVEILRGDKRQYPELNDTELRARLEEAGHTDHRLLSMAFDVLAQEAAPRRRKR